MQQQVLLTNTAISSVTAIWHSSYGHKAANCLNQWASAALTSANELVKPFMEAQHRLQCARALLRLPLYSTNNTHCMHTHFYSSLAHNKQRHYPIFARNKLASPFDTQVDL